MEHTTTWKPWNGHGKLPKSAYALPRHRRAPLTDRFEVHRAFENLPGYPDLSDQEREEAFANIKKAADHFNLELCGESYEEACHRPQVIVAPVD